MSSMMSFGVHYSVRCPKHKETQCSSVANYTIAAKVAQIKRRLTVDTLLLVAKKRDRKCRLHVGPLLSRKNISQLQQRKGAKAQTNSRRRRRMIDHQLDDDEYFIQFKDDVSEENELTKQEVSVFVCRLRSVGRSPKCFWLSSRSPSRLSFITSQDFVFSGAC